MNIGSISVTVSNFGPIANKTIISLRPFMVFSGISGLGKSYLAMLVHYVYRVLIGDELLVYLREKQLNYDSLKEKIDGDEGVLCEFDEKDYVEWVNRRAVVYMRHILGNNEFTADIHIDMPGMNGVFKFVYSRTPVMNNDLGVMEYVESLRFGETNDISLQLPQYGGTWGGFPFMFIIHRYFRKKYDINLQRTMYMPPSRGSLVALPDEVRLNMHHAQSMYGEFLDDLSRLKALQPKENPDAELREMRTILKNEIIAGTIEIRDNELHYVHNGAPMPIMAAASSVKELAPLALMMQKGFNGMYSILFEEPESHLHPELQLKVVQLLVYSLSVGSHVQITTHSDYIIRHINDMIRLHVLRECMQDEVRYNEYCREHGFNPDYSLDPDIVGAYFLKQASDGGTEVVPQNVENGVPMDTFTEVLKKQLAQSAGLYDIVEEVVRR